MNLITYLAAAAALLPAAVQAHGSAPGIPKLFGRNAIRDLKARGHSTSREPRAEYYERTRAHTQSEDKRSTKQSRQNTNGACGAGQGSCAPGYCCSPSVSPSFPEEKGLLGSLQGHFVEYRKSLTNWLGLVWHRKRLLRRSELSVQLWFWLRCEHRSTWTKDRLNSSSSTWQPVLWRCGHLRLCCK